MQRRIFLVVAIMLAVGCSPQAGSPASGGNGEGPGVGRFGTRSLLADGSTEVRLAPGERATLRAVVTEGEQPLAGVPVTFEIVGPAAGAALSAERAQSDGWGRVAVLVVAVTEARFAVRAEVTGADPLEWSVQVARPTQGDLAITVPYAGPASRLQELGGGWVRAHRASVKCEDMAPRDPPRTAVAEAALVAAGDTVRLNGIEAGLYTVVVSVERRDRPVTMAWGCREQVRVVGGERRAEVLPASPVPVVVLGPYTVTATYQFTEGLPGVLGDFVAILTAAFDDRDIDGRRLSPPADDPGYFFAEILLYEIFGGADPLATSLLAAVLNEQVIARVPWLDDLAEVGRSLVEALTRLEVSSELVVERRGGDKFTATERGDAVVVHHRGQPFRFSLRDPRLLPGGGTSAIEGNMEVQYADTHLELQPHKLRFAYGRLAVLLLEQVLLPQLTGLSTLRDALGALVDCTALAARLVGTFLPIPAGVCEGALDAASVLLRSALDRLTVTPTWLSREGGAEAVDTDLDSAALADVLEGGRWQGALDVGSNSVPFTATWEATRRGH